MFWLSQPTCQARVTQVKVKVATKYFISDSNFNVSPSLKFLHHEKFYFEGNLSDTLQSDPFIRILTLLQVWFNIWLIDWPLLIPWPVPQSPLNCDVRAVLRFCNVLLICPCVVQNVPDWRALTINIRLAKPSAFLETRDMGNSHKRPKGRKIKSPF